MRSLLGGPVQVAYAVGDVHRGVAQWTDLGFGPFVVREHIEVVNARIDGLAGEFDHSSAFAQWGDLMVELIAVHGPDAPPPGLHHMAYFVDDFATASAALVEDGHAEALYAATESGVEFGFFDGADRFGHLIEIYERSEGLDAFYKHVREMGSS